MFIFIHQNSCKKQQSDNPVHDTNKQVIITLIHWLLQIFHDILKPTHWVIGNNFSLFNPSGVFFEFYLW